MQVMLHFRKLAHAQVRRQEKQSTQKASLQRTWVGWALGFKAPSGQGAAIDAVGTAQAAQGEDERPYLTADEVQTLEDAVQEQVWGAKTPESALALTGFACMKRLTLYIEVNPARCERWFE
jgi:hypothetical protein